MDASVARIPKAVDFPVEIQTLVLKSFKILFDGTTFFGTNVYNRRPNTSAHKSFRSSVILREIVTTKQREKTTVMFKCKVNEGKQKGWGKVNGNVKS